MFTRPGPAAICTSSLRGAGVDTIIITGGETDVCVLATMLGAVDWGFRVILVTDALCSSADETHDAMMNVYMNRFGAAGGMRHDRNPSRQLAGQRQGEARVMSASYLVQILLPKETRQRRAVSQGWFEDFLEELTDKFGGATSFVRRRARVYGAAAARPSGTISRSSRSWPRGSHPSTGAVLRERLERELSQEEIVIRAQEIIAL